MRHGLEGGGGYAGQQRDPSGVPMALEKDGLAFVSGGPGKFTVKAFTVKASSTTTSAVIQVHGMAWFDFIGNEGGRGSLSLAMRVMGLGPEEAARWIVSNVKGCQAAKALREAVEMESVSAEAEHAGKQVRL